MKHQTVKTVKRKLDILGLKAPSKLPNTTKTTKPMNKNTIKVVKSQPEVYQDYEGYDIVWEQPNNNKENICQTERKPLQECTQPVKLLP